MLEEAFLARLQAIVTEMRTISRLTRPLFSNRFHTFLRPSIVFSFRKMSSAAALAQLPQSLHDLVVGAVQEGEASADFGKSEKDQAEVMAWKRMW